MNLKTLIFLPAALLSGIAMAETVSPEQALDKALGFFSQPARARGPQSAAQPLTLAHTAQADGETYFYVFNNAAGGYVIVGGDDVAHDVLAYSESGTFDYDQLAPATRWWLGQYQSQIHSAIAAERQGIAAHSLATRATTHPEVKPLLGGMGWNQMNPYNMQILDNDRIEDPMEQYVAGCVATAMAQVMRYWKYPERGMGCHAYRLKGQLLEADFAASTYQWDLMQDTYGLLYSGTPEEDAVAKLMSDVGIALNMEYGTPLADGSTTSEQNIPYALRTYFGYSKDMKLLYRDSMVGLADGEWEDIVYGELAEGRPVIYSGSHQNVAIGHTFVCDGYKDGYFHINWGTAGVSNDTYYLLTSTETTQALTPMAYVEGIGEIVAGQYDSHHSIIIGIQPDAQSEGFVYHSQPMVIPAEAALHETLHLEGRFHNPTSREVKASVVAILFDDDFFFTQDSDTYISQQTVVFPAGQEVTVSFDIPTDALIPGIRYRELFEILDLTDPEVTEENYLAKTWLFCTGVTHIEGPEYIWLDLSLCSATLCVPFDTELPEGVRAYTAESITADGHVIMKPASSIEAGKCYLVMSDEPIVEPILLSGMRTTDQAWGTGPVFKGNLTSESLYYLEACYVLDTVNGEDVLTRKRYAHLLANRALVDGSLSDADVLYFSFDETTGIQQVRGLSDGSLRFNPMGQPQHEARGLAIDGGRVVFVK